MYKIGESLVDFDRLDIHGPNGIISMESMVMDVLKVLTENAGQVVSREELIDKVWGVGFGADERLTRAISLLRKAFGQKNKDQRYIQTIPRKGYLLDVHIDPDVTIPDSHRSAATISKVSPIHIPQSEPTNPRYFSRIIISTFSALLVLLIATNLNLNGAHSNLAQPKPSVGSGLEKIYNFTRKDAIHEAQTIFEIMLAEDPDHAAARAGLSLSLLREYTHLERDPALLNRAHSNAEAAYRQDENLALANIAVAWTSEFKGDFERAHKFLDRAAILDPDNMLAMEGRSRVYFKTGKREEMRNVVNRGIEEYPEHPIFYDHSGQLHIWNSDFEGAKQSFQSLIEVSNKTNPQAYAQLAQVFHLLGDTETATKTIQLGLEIRESSNLYTNLGTYLFFQGKYEMAASAFEKSIDLSGDAHNYLYWANLADAYRQIPGKEMKSTKAYRRAIQLVSNIENADESIVSLSRLSLYHAKIGKFKDARNYLNKIPADKKKTGTDCFRLAIIFELLSDRTSALKNLELSLKKGHSRREILNEPELSFLREDKDFHMLLIQSGEQYE